MAEFMEVLEDIRSSESEARRLFGADGSRRMRRGGKSSPRYMRKLANAAKFVGDVMTGRAHPSLLQEAMTTSDFPILFGDILDRQVLAAYREWPSTWEGIAKRVLLNDFRSAKFYPPPYGADSRLDEVAEQEEYPESKITEQSAITMKAKKFGRRIPFSWETMVNDDLNQLRDAPTRFGRAARRTENRAVMELYVGSTGYNTTFFNNTNKNIVNTTNGALTTNPTLTIGALQDAWKIIMAQKDESGEPIFLDFVTLVVPPSLETVAQNIINATQIEVTAGSAGGNAAVQRTDATPSNTGEQRLVTTNWMRNRLRLIVDPYIPSIATTNGNTTWFMFADPMSDRPGIQIGFLRGHEEPEIWIKTPNARRVGGGDVDPMEGDFDTDSIHYRVRHVLGVTTIDPKAAVASNGSGA
jgi:hypothetical protein